MNAPLNEKFRFPLNLAFGGRLMLRTFCILSIVMMAGAAPVPVQAQTQDGDTSSPSHPSTGLAAFVRPQAPGRLNDVGGRRLHILCKGADARRSKGNG